MHRVFQIPEILLNIFRHCPLPRESATSDLLALARTCHAFKEPALDVLWEGSVEPSALVQCLPEASQQLGRVRSSIRFASSDCEYFCSMKRYSFNRPLTHIEWGILRSYTRRIRSMGNNRDRLDWESARTFLNPPIAEPLFPNLRRLYFHLPTKATIEHFLYMPFPSLISFDVWIIDREDLYLLQGPLESFYKFSPDIKRLSITSVCIDIAFSNFFSSYICGWRDLRAVDCNSVALDADALAHLSHMPALSHLSFTPSATLPPSDLPIFFTNLRHLTLFSRLLDPISLVLSWVRLPTITHFTFVIYCRPSKQDFSSFLTSAQTSGLSHTIREFVLEEGCRTLHDAEDAILGFEALEPCMAFSNLRRIYVDLAWKVDLSDRELLTLAPAWAHLEHLLINMRWGWNTLGGITPDGLLQLLQTCRSLCDIALAIDARGYTKFHELPASLGLTLPPTFSINVLDSFIEEESVPVIAAFLAGIAPRPNFSFIAHRGLRRGSERTDHKDRWYDAYRRANDILRQDTRHTSYRIP